MRLKCILYTRNERCVKLERCGFCVRTACLYERPIMKGAKTETIIDNSLMIKRKASFSNEIVNKRMPLCQEKSCRYDR